MFTRRNRNYEDSYNNKEDGYDFNMPPPVRITKRDYFVAFLIGIAVFVFAFALMPSGLHPRAWVDCAQAASLRPPSGILSGCWRFLAHMLYSFFGISGASFIISLGGKITLGVIAGFSYLIFRELVSLVIRVLPKDGVFSKKIIYICSVAASLFVSFSDPIWNVCQAFTVETFRLSFFFATVFLFLHFFNFGTIKSGYLAIVVAGLFSAVSPLGLILVAIFFVLFVLLRRKRFLDYVEINNIFIYSFSRWRLTILGVSAVILVISLNVIAFILQGGLEANGLTAGDLPLQYVFEYWSLIKTSVSIGGLFLYLAFCVIPMVIALLMIIRSVDIDIFLKYQSGIIFFIIASVSYSQLSFLRPLWFWTWSSTSSLVSSDLLLCVGVFCCALALFLSLCVFAIEIYCRNNYKLLQKRDPESVQDINAVEMSSPILNFAGTIIILCLLIGVVYARYQPRTCEMTNLMRSYVQEIVSEVGDARWLFTDGAFDCAIELEGARRGKNIACLSLLQSPAARSKYSAIQTVEDKEDRLSLEVGAGNLLRTWERDKPNRLEQSAFMLGFELWRRSGKNYPDVAGAIGRTRGKYSNEDREVAITRTYSLIEKILNIYAKGGPSKYAGTYVNDLFLLMQWRLARIARVRSELYDLADNGERAKEEGRLADVLDKKNASLQRILEGMSRLKELTMRQMTPREGLQFALVRADFALARHYAEPILDADEDDPSANFGMGMSYFMEQQWTRAEEYLRRSLIRSAKEPAIWNNLAVLQLRTGRLKEAYENAKKALSLLPNSVEVLDTIKQIEIAMEDEKKKKNNAIEELKKAQEIDKK